MKGRQGQSELETGWNGQMAAGEAARQRMAPMRGTGSLATDGGCLAQERASRTSLPRHSVGKHRPRPCCRVLLPLGRRPCSVRPWPRRIAHCCLAAHMAATRRPRADTGRRVKKARCTHGLATRAALAAISTPVESVLRLRWGLAIARWAGARQRAPGKRHPAVHVTTSLEARLKALVPAWKPLSRIRAQLHV